MMTREEQLLQVAADLFARKGYERTSLQDISEEVGLLKGSLYHYIKSKDELLFKVVKPASASSIKELEEIKEMPISTPEKISKAVDSLVNLYDKCYPQFSVFLGEKLSGLPETYKQELIQDQAYYEKLLVEIIAEGQSKGEIKANLNTKIVVFAMLGLCNWMYRWYRPNGLLAPEEISKIFNTIILSGLET